MKNDLPVPEFGKNLIENLNSEDLGRYVIYTQEVPWKLFGGRFKAEPLKILMVEQVGLEVLVVRPRLIALGLGYVGLPCLG